MTTFTFPTTKDDFTADNGVTYTWDVNRWRTKSFLTADGSEVEVGPMPPTDPSEGGLWYDSNRLELFVYYVDPDDNGGWVPCSPLGARVEAGEALQQEILQRVEVGEAKQAQIEADYLKKSGGTVDGLLTVTSTNAQADNAYVFNVQGPRLPEGQTSAFRVTAGGSVKAGHSSGAPFMASSANDLITKAYFDANQGEDVDLSGYLPLSGGTLTNALCFNRGGKPNVQLCIEPNSGSTDTNIYSLSDGQVRFRSSHTADISDRIGSHIVLDPNNGEPETKIYHLVSPTDSAMAANRQYVDETAASPAHLEWQYNGTVNNDASDPGSGNMVWDPNGTDGIIGYLRFSFVTRNGLTNLGDGKFADTIVSMDYGPIGTVWQYRFDIKKWKLMLQFRVGHFRWNYNNHFEMGLTSQNGRRFEDLATSPYFVTVGGFF
nr:hypothetical protein [uncultured Mediterranean phage uvMED]